MIAQDIEERDSITTRWLVVVVLLSLLAHIIFILVIVLINSHIPKFKPVIPAANPLVTLTLQPPPATQPPQHPIFMPTQPDAAAKFQNQLVESDNNTTLKSQSPTARDPNSIMPDVTGKEHAADLANSPNVPAKKQPSPPTQPTPEQNQAKQQPTPPQPKQPPQKNQQTQQTKPQPPQPKPPATQAVKNAVDPVTGLPVLPPITAPTLAQQTPVSANQAAQNASASPILPAVATSVHGAVGTRSDAASPAAMATEFGRYKAKVYRAISSRWHPKVDNSFQVLPVGTVHIQFTIHADGTLETKVLDGGNSTLQMLLSISLNSLTESAPFDPFTDSLRKEIAKEQNNDGESYTDDCTFSIYSN